MMRRVDPFLPDDDKLAAIRELLPSTSSGIRLDATVAGPFPLETDRALQEADRWELRVGRGGPDRTQDLVQRAEEARSVIAAVLSGRPARVLLAPGPVAAVDAILASATNMRLERVLVVGEIRDVLLASVHAVASLRGADLAQTPRFPGGTIDGPGTMVVAGHADSATGALLDTVSLAVSTHAAGALLVLDAAWTAGAVPVDGPGCGADAILADGHRWLLGPEGVTALWVGERLDAERAASVLDPLPRATLLGLARSVGWLLMYVGLPWAFERAARLTARLRDALARVDGVELTGPAQGLATTIVFRIQGWSVDEAAVELGRRCFAMLDVDAGRGLLRAGVGAWLAETELDRFAAAVGDLASHTPESLPRRPMLTLVDVDEADNGR